MSRNLSKRQFWSFKLFYVGFTLVWLVCLFWLYISDVPNWILISLVALLIFTTPSLDDLFVSYRGYLEDRAAAVHDPAYDHVMCGKVVKIVEPPRMSAGMLKAKVSFGPERWEATIDEVQGGQSLKEGDHAVVYKGFGHEIHIRPVNKRA